MLKVAELSKATYMRWIKRLNEKDKDYEIKEKMIQIRQENPNYGYRRICAELRHQGIVVNNKKILRLVQELQIQVTSFSQKSGKFSTYKGEIGKVAKNEINRNFKSNIPHEKITTDTSEFKYYEYDKNNNPVKKKLYLNVFMDMYNSEIISYSISKAPTLNAVIEAVDKAILIVKDCPTQSIFHSDQGCFYQLPQYTNRLKRNNIKQSMSRKGNCLDNSIMENFFGILKQEMYYRKEFRSYEGLRKEIQIYIDYYNNKRIKMRLGYMSPVQYRVMGQK